MILIIATGKGNFIILKVYSRSDVEPFFTCKFLYNVSFLGFKSSLDFKLSVIALKNQNIRIKKLNEK